MRTRPDFVDGSRYISRTSTPDRIGVHPSDDGASVGINVGVGVAVGASVGDGGVKVGMGVRVGNSGASSTRAGGEAASSAPGAHAVSQTSEARNKMQDATGAQASCLLHLVSCFCCPMLIENQHGAAILALVDQFEMR